MTRTWTPSEIVVQNEILRRIGDGESLRSVCRTPGFPGATTFTDWCVADSQLAEQYARAREQRADVYFDKLDEISEDARAAEDPVEVQGLRLAADNIKWQLGKMSKRFNDKVAHEHSGVDGKPIQTENVNLDVAVSPDGIEAARQYLKIMEGR